MGQVAVPVKSVGVTAADFGIDGIPIQPVRPEGRCLLRLEVRFVPHVASEFPPVGMPGVQVGLIYGKALRIFVGDESGLPGSRRDLWKDGLAKAHVIVSADRIAVRLVIDVIPDVEVHAASDIFHDQSVAPRLRTGKVDAPDRRTGQVLAAGFVFAVRCRLPETDGPGFGGGSGLYII